MNCRSHTPTALSVLVLHPRAFLFAVLETKVLALKLGLRLAEELKLGHPLRSHRRPSPLSCVRFLQLNSVCRYPPTSSPCLTSWSFQSEVSSRQERVSVGRALKMLSLRFFHISHSTVANNSSLGRDVRLSLDDLHRGGTTGQTTNSVFHAFFIVLRKAWKFTLGFEKSLPYKGHYRELD
ncbi:uncharacterized protein LOC115679626 isoform X2 [Syzygium oleosum]|uniref:uncharacterized protein LOC115679626 isoform X2 n=1 Tax=Syzygium oleosum TaxID=219896 RepID=UPI0024BAE526|nr:uncharacterized protein LOC115679626 isoform X2 [Syzygium oleosum]